jgi:hypothetical protein
MFPSIAPTIWAAGEFYKNMQTMLDEESGTQLEGLSPEEAMKAYLWAFTAMSEPAGNC